MNPVTQLLLSAISIYQFLLMIWLILSMLINFQIVSNVHVRMIQESLKALFEPILEFIRRYIPAMGMLDLSPIILFLALEFIQDLIVYYL